MIHLTFTGYYAGRLLCNGTKQDTDRAYHAMYCSDAMLNNPDVCPACLAVWNSADDDQQEA